MTDETRIMWNVITIYGETIQIYADLFQLNDSGTYDFFASDLRVASVPTNSVVAVIKEGHNQT